MEKEDNRKQRVRFCWECGNKLRGNHFKEVQLPYNNGTVIMHKKCAEEFDKEMLNPHEGSVIWNKIKN